MLRRSLCSPTPGPRGPVSPRPDSRLGETRLRVAADPLLALGDPAWSSGTVESLTNRAARLLKHCGVELIVLDEFHHLFDVDRAKVMTKASQWIKVLIVNTGLPVVVCGMPEAEYVLSAEHTERRFKQRLTLRCFTWRTPQGQREFCGMLKKLDETLPLAESSGLANADLAGRFYLASRGVLECGDLSPLWIPLGPSLRAIHIDGPLTPEKESGDKSPHSKGRRPGPHRRCRPIASRQRG